MKHSRSQPTFLTLLCIGLVAGCLLLSVTSFVLYRDFTRASADLRDAREELQSFQTAYRNADADREELKRLLGYHHFEIGDRESAAPNTVVGEALQDLREYAGEVPEKTLHAALIKLAAELENAIRERDELLADRNGLQKRYLALENKWKSVVDVEREARMQAEKLVQDGIDARAEAQQAQQAKIEEYREITRDQRIEIAGLNEQLARLNEDIRQRTTQHRAALQLLNDRLDDHRPGNFERPDGRIRIVEAQTRLVWVDIGSRDGLQTGVTFNVYPRNFDQTAPSSRKPKGSIRITRITGPRTAEARIVEEDPRDPFLEGDVIHTPLWSPGQTRSFAFVGTIDLDGDGQSDWRQLESLIKAAGAEIKSYVDEEGRRTGDGIDLSVKFLVVGKIPDPTAARTDGQRDAANQVLQHLTTMRREAQEHGVQILNLSDFLEYIGYRPTGRLRQNRSATVRSTLQERVQALREAAGYDN